MVEKGEEIESIICTLCSSDMDIEGGTTRIMDACNSKRNGDIDATRDMTFFK